MTVIARVHTVHLINAEVAEQHQVAANPQTKPIDLNCQSACRLLSFTVSESSTDRGSQHLRWACDMGCCSLFEFHRHRRFRTPLLHNKFEVCPQNFTIFVRLFDILVKFCDDSFIGRQENTQKRSPLA